MFDYPQDTSGGHFDEITASARHQFLGSDLTNVDAGAKAIMTPERWWGFAPHASIISHTGTVSAALWRFQQPVHEVKGPADHHINLISIPISGCHHHTYFADGRRKWSREHPAFHTNIVVAGERPRSVFVSQRPFAYLHVYMPHALIERVAVDSAAVDTGGAITLIDPMCSRDPHLETICRQVAREMAQPDQCARLVIDFLGQELAVHLLRQHSNISGSRRLSAKSGPGYRDWRLRRAIEYLEAHLGEDVGLNDVAAITGLSTTHVANLFRAGTGEPPHRWLMRRRFERACELLGNPALTVTDIAHACGFASSQHLATVMRKRLQTTPTAYRRDILG
jgi:AraC family transcriptional regulator